jgi:hypothetical protein
VSSDAYQEYLTRFHAAVGQVAVGGYGKWKGKLVRKLSPVEFTTKHGEWSTLARTYRGIIERGDTLNDAVTRLLRERQAELIIEEDELLP